MQPVIALRRPETPIINEMKMHPKDKDFLERVMNNFCVDDLIAGSSSLSGAKCKTVLLKNVFAAGKFKFKKSSTNSMELGKFLEEEFSSFDAQLFFHGKSNGRFLGDL